MKRSLSLVPVVLLIGSVLAGASTLISSKTQSRMPLSPSAEEP